MKGGIIMPITDIPTALQNITACACNPNMNVISLDITQASSDMINAIRDKMREFPEFVEVSYMYEPGHLVYERRK